MMMLYIRDASGSREADAAQVLDRAGTLREEVRRARAREMPRSR